MTTMTAVKRSLKNKKLRPFQILSRLFGPAQLYLSNVGHFSCSLILKDFIQVQKKKGKIVLVFSRPL